MTLYHLICIKVWNVLCVNININIYIYLIYHIYDILLYRDVYSNCSTPCVYLYIYVCDDILHSLVDVFISRFWRSPFVLHTRRSSEFTLEYCQRCQWIGQALAFGEKPKVDGQVFIAPQRLAVLLPECLRSWVVNSGRLWQSRVAAAISTLYCMCVFYRDSTPKALKSFFIPMVLVEE